MKKIITSFLITEDRLQLLDTAAKDMDLDRSKLLRRLVEHFLSTCQPAGHNMVTLHPMQPPHSQ